MSEFPAVTVGPAGAAVTMPIPKHILGDRAFGIGARSRTIRVWAAPACMLVLILILAACQNQPNPSNESATVDTSRPISWLATDASATQPTGPSSILVYIEMVEEKKYGLLAHLIGKQDITVRHTLYNVDHPWWDNPLIAYADAPFMHPDVFGQADADAISGQGNGAHVSVRVTLVPHAVVAVRTIPPSDCIIGTIAISVTTVADFFDGTWTDLVREKDKRLIFSFNTCEPGRRLQETVHEIRAVPPFSLERYTRGHEKWEPMTRWPDEPKSGDARTVIYGKDATLDVTGYRYVEQ